METRSIKCDNCGKELVIDTKYPTNYCLKLSSANYAYNRSGTTYAILGYPHVDRDHHFCDLKCLRDHVNQELEKE